MVIYIFAIVLGLVLLTLSSDWLVTGGVNLSRKMGVSPLFIGLTVVAFGTSMPELVVSVQASLEGNSGIAIGNVVGSNIFNAAFILGVAALIQPIPCKSAIVRRDVPVMILTGVLLWWMTSDRVVSAKECTALLALLVLYVGVSYILGRREATPESPVETQVEKATSLGCDFGNIATGLAGLVGGSKLLLYGAVSTAQTLGISDEIIGLTLVAVGTSLPELATSVMAARKGQSEIAIGNVVGSNIFNILGIIGVAGILLPLQVSEHMFRMDIPVMVVICLGCLPIMQSNSRIDRPEGLVLLGSYLAYMYLLILAPS